jgi:hypothetical protein
MTLAASVEWEALFEEWRSLLRLLLQDADEVLRTARADGLTCVMLEGIADVEDDARWSADETD